MIYYGIRKFSIKNHFKKKDLYFYLNESFCLCNYAKQIKCLKHDSNSINFKCFSRHAEKIHKCQIWYFVTNERSHYWHLHNFKHGKSFLRWSSVFFRGLFGSIQVRDNIISLEFFLAQKMENDRISYDKHWLDKLDKLWLANLSIFVIIL